MSTAATATLSYSEEQKKYGDAWMHNNFVCCVHHDPITGGYEARSGLFHDQAESKTYAGYLAGRYTNLQLNYTVYINGQPYMSEQFTN